MTRLRPALKPHRKDAMGSARCNQEEYRNMLQRLRPCCLIAACFAASCDEPAERPIRPADAVLTQAELDRASVSSLSIGMRPAGPEACREISASTAQLADVTRNQMRYSKGGNLTIAKQLWASLPPTARREIVAVARMAALCENSGNARDARILVRDPADGAILHVESASTARDTTG